MVCSLSHTEISRKKKKKGVQNFRQNEMVILHQLPRLHSSIFLPKTPFLYTHFNLLPKPKLPTKTTSTLFSALNSTLSTTSKPIPIPTHNLDIPEETHVPISIEKLFVPPDTDVSSDTAASLSTRILKGSNIVLSKYARDAQVSQADFVKSSVDTQACPSDGLPEFALVGRSNVGKSSLLNSIVRRKKLALTSKKPGLLLHFKFEKCYLQVCNYFFSFFVVYYVNFMVQVSS